MRYEIHITTNLRYNGGSEHYPDATVEETALYFEVTPTAQIKHTVFRHPWHTITRIALSPLDGPDAE